MLGGDIALQSKNFLYPHIIQTCFTVSSQIGGKMKKISRRKAIKYVGSSIFIAGGMNSCCCLRDIIGRPCDPREEWKKEGKEWWAGRKKEREKEREREIREGTRPDIEIPFPYLEIMRDDGIHGSVMHQLREFVFNQWGDLYVYVTNRGNAPTWNCIIETYETPTIPYGDSFTSFTLNDRKIVSLMAGQSKEVMLKFRVTKAVAGFGCRCYDPISDPGPGVYLQYDRHNSGLGWNEWLGGQ